MISIYVISSAILFLASCPHRHNGKCVATDILVVSARVLAATEAIWRPSMAAWGPITLNVSAATSTELYLSDIDLFHIAIFHTSACRARNLDD